MRETRADTRTAVLQALGLHVVLFALLYAGLDLSRSDQLEPAHGDVIEAELVDPSALSAPMRRALLREPEPLPEPLPEPEPAPPPPEPEPEREPRPEPVPEQQLPPPVPDPQPVEQEKVQRDAPAPEVAKVRQEQEEKRKQPPQSDLDAERQRKLAEVRAQMEKVRREADLAEQRARQLADARTRQAAPSAAPPRGNPDSRSANDARYKIAVKDAITRQWIRPESIPTGIPCQVRIRQIPGGEVVDVQVSSGCPYDARGRESLERAVLKASPLPYAGFEDVFNRDIVLTFRPEDVDDL